MTHLKKFLLTLFIGGVALLSEFVLHQPGLAFMIIAFTGGILAFVVSLEMIKTLRLGRYGVDILAITAILATLAVKEYWVSLMILIMFTGGDSLENCVNKRVSRGLQSLLDNTSRTAHRFKEGRWQGIVVDEINMDDQLLVKPDEFVPVDGRVIKGELSVDESSLTGEFRPETKKLRDQIMSRSLNGSGSIQMITEKRAADSQYQMIIKLVEESKRKPARLARLANRYAVPFTLITYLIGGISWWFSKNPLRFAEVLVIASPCPLILVVPIVLVAGVGCSSKNGIVVKTGAMIEKLVRTKTIVFGRTGTFTEGMLEVEAVQPANGMKKEELLIYAASAEQESSYTLARSLVNSVKNSQLYPVSQLKEMTGQRIQAVVNNRDVGTGRASLVSMEEAEASETTIYIAIDQPFAGTILLSDQIHSEAARTIRELRNLGVRNLMMITGDGSAIVQVIAEEVRLDSVHTHCLSQDKLAVSERTPKDQQPVAAIGDGVDDVPTPVAADIDTAMGARDSTAASESADMVVLRDDLLRVTKTIMVSRDTMRIAKQPVLIGIFICIFLMLIASMGLVPALFGAVLQEAADTVSILSALRTKKDPTIFRDSVPKTNIT